MTRHTTPPATPVLLYDGGCPLCRRWVDRLQRLLNDKATVDYRSITEPHVLAPFPGLSRDAVQASVHFVDTQGRVFKGIDAVVEVLRLRRSGKVAALLRLPGIRTVADWIYRWVARHRYELGEH